MGRGMERGRDGRRGGGQKKSDGGGGNGEPTGRSNDGEMLCHQREEQRRERSRVEPPTSLAGVRPA